MVTVASKEHALVCSIIALASYNSQQLAIGVVHIRPALSDS